MYAVLDRDARPRCLLVERCLVQRLRVVELVLIHFREETAQLLVLFRRRVEVLQLVVAAGQQ
jgi:hypothetical protein